LDYPASNQQKINRRRIKLTVARSIFAAHQFASEWASNTVYAGVNNSAFISMLLRRFSRRIAEEDTE
jgi:hypothetical protein